MIEEHWDEDKHKFEDDFEGRHGYRDDQRRGYGEDGYRRGGGDTIIENQTFVEDNDRYGGGYRRGDNTIIENETIVNDDRYDDYRPSNETFVENETIVNEDSYDDRRDDRYRRDEYRDDGFVDDAARWTGDKVRSHLWTPLTKHLLIVFV